MKSVNEPPHDKTNKMTCAPSEDSDQPGHPPGLIRVFAARMKKAWVLSYPLSVLRRLWSDWADAQADLVFAWRTVILLVLSWGGSNERLLLLLHLLVSKINKIKHLEQHHHWILNGYRIASDLMLQWLWLAILLSWQDILLQNTLGSST